VRLPHALHLFGYFLCFKQLVENVFQQSAVTEWPKRFVLVAKDDVLKDGFADAQEHGHLLLDLCALVVYRQLLAFFALCLKRLLDGFESGRAPLS
jgi:hypothetical protein